MARSISARIFTSFAVVIVAFSGVVGYAVYRMRGVHQQLELINTTYLQLMVIGSELNYTQARLVNRIAERADGRSTTEFLRRQIDAARQFRSVEVQRALKLIQRAERRGLDTADRHFLGRVRGSLRELEHAFSADEKRFARLFSTEEISAATLQEIGDALLRGELKLDKLTRTLHNKLRGRLKSTALVITANQGTALWSGLLLVILALVFSLAVTFRAQRTLRPLRTLVAGTKRIGAGDYAGRVAVESRDELGVLADEFNNMAAAVQERELRLIRSERMAAAGRLASHITHEVRNPLNSISLNTELLEEELGEIGAQGADELRTLCSAIRREVDRLTGITEEYLRFARLPKPNLEQEDINELLESLLEFMGGELRERGVTVIPRWGDVPGIQADENQLRTAFLNLVRNAGEAMADSGGGELRVSTRAVEGEVEIVIADTGPGIEEEHVRQVFDPFFTTKRSGTGLGLPLTHQIINEHGGQIAVTSKPGEGTVFTVRLPATRGA